MALTKKAIKEHMISQWFTEDRFGSFYRKYDNGDEYRLIFKPRVFQIQKKVIMNGETKFIRIKSGNYTQAKIQDGKFVNLKT